MPRLRLWIWLAVALAAIVALSLLLQAFNSLVWQLSYLLPPALVGPLLLLVLGGGGVLLLRLAWPWLRAWRTPRQLPGPGQGPLPAPSSRQEAVGQQLRAIDPVLERVRDQVAREALRQERDRVEAELARGDLVLVVFGSGSAGKTSLIRALLNQVVGEVGAAMGSTTTCLTYRLRLKGLQRGLQLVDTPGILESGRDGQERELAARQQAARADLLVLVVDGDLRAAEFQVFEALASLGKRLVLVLNKCDLRGEEEERRLLALLRQRCAGRITPDDVIPAAAAPQSIPRPGGRPLQPGPEVDALLRRLSAVLHQDGEELIADNILLQSQRLSDASRALLSRQRRQDGEAIIDRYMWIGAGVLVVNPLPVVDLLGTAAVNAQMVVELGRVYGVTLTREAGQDLALSVGRTLAGLGVIKGGLGLITTALSLNLPALVVSKAVQGVSAAWLTRIAGLSFLTYFEQGQDWGDGGLQEVVQRQYDLNRREGALRGFLEVALRRVVEPLQRRRDRQLPPRPGPRGEGAGGGPGHRAP
ncbi:YcjF family protein [Synechococcus sp. CS-205]|jgi:small GTP-binding protein|uniref:YcjF family protein n=1 Tax=Synechococcus sp. CS-205 TaxID=2847984 RepID=UPI00223C3651|nr:GTP-binding protein [Synechococcus sp. CS-205]MCT0248418.1 GTP-binding protein [Synechococcus sp. CS-205]